MYKPKYFKAHELVPPNIYEKFGERSFMFIDDRLLRLIDGLRIKFGAATINNYDYGGNRKYSGLRTPDSDHYNPTSQHSFGRAVDIIFSKVSAKYIREQIKKDPNYWLSAAGCESITLEDDVSWLHIDIRNSGKGVNSFKP